MAKPNMPTDKEKYTFEEWERIGIEKKGGLEFITIRIHGAVEDHKYPVMCFHTAHTHYDEENDETTGIMTVLRQRWEPGGYHLKPVIMNRIVDKSSLKDDPTIGRLP